MHTRPNPHRRRTRHHNPATANPTNPTDAGSGTPAAPALGTNAVCGPSAKPKSPPFPINSICPSLYDVASVRKMNHRVPPASTFGVATGVNGPPVISTGIVNNPAELPVNPGGNPSVTTENPPGSVTVRIADPGAGNPSWVNPKSGIMIRQNLADTAANAALIETPNGNTSSQYRGQGEWSTTSVSGSNYTSPVYLKLSKSGDTITSYTSSDGASWTTLTSQTLHFTGAYYVGMMVDSENNYSTNTATFDNFSVTGTTPTELPNGWSDTDIGSPTMPGSASYDNGTITFSVNGGGAQISGTSDQFNYAYQTLTGDGSIIAHLADAATTSSAWALGGIMIRNGLSDADPHAAMILAKNGTTQFLSRATTSATTTAAYGTSSASWLKLTRIADTFTGYTSSDGITWTQTSSATLSMSGQIYIGLVANSGNTGDGQTVAFDNVTTTGVTPTGPAAPTNFTLDFPDSSYARLSWDAAPANSGITGYNVYMSTNGSPFSLLTTIADPAATSYDLTGLDPNTPYAFHLAATGPSSTESPAATASDTSPDGIKAATCLSSVAGSINSPNDAISTLSWTNHATGILKTFIELKEAGDSNWFTLVDVDSPDTTTTASLTGLSVGGTYQARVRTITASGSAYSAPADLDVPDWQSDPDLYGEPYFASSGDVAWTSASQYPQEHTLFAHAPGTLFPDRWYGTGQITTGGLTPSANTYAWLGGHWGGVLANSQTAGYADPYEPALPNTRNGENWVTGARDSNGKVHLSWDAQPGYQYEIMGLGDPFQWDWTSGTFDTDTYYTDPVTSDPKEIIAYENGSGGHNTARSGYFAVASSHTQNGQIVYSPPSQPVDLAVAYTPKYFTAKARSNAISLFWDNAAYNETGYAIDRSDNGGQTWTSLGQTEEDSAEFIDRTALVGTTYKYRLKALRDDKLSENLDSGYITATAVIQPSFIDLDIDSDNTNGLSAPDRSQPEDQIEDQSDSSHPGKIIWADTGDSDADGIPDFADGFGGNTQGQDNSSARLTPLMFQVTSDIDPNNLFVKFDYPQASPNNVTAPDGADGAWSPGNGAIRIWTKDGSVHRAVSDDLVNSGTTYALPDFDLEKVGDTGDTYMLYVEGVNPSTDVGQAAMSVTLSSAGQDLASDQIRATVLNNRLDAVSADGTVNPATKLVTSTPSPKVDLADYHISNVHVSADGLHILGSLTLAGTVDSDVADSTRGDMGTIDNVTVYLNGELAPTGTIEVQSSKTSNGLLKPFDFSGTFSETLTDVVLDSGVNKVRVAAQDKIYHLFGFEDALLEVVANPPYTFALHFDVGSGTSTDPQTAYLAVSYPDIPSQSFSLTLYRSNPGAYAGQLNGQNITLTVGDPDAFSQDLSDPDANAEWTANIGGLPVFSDPIPMEKSSTGSLRDYKNGFVSFQGYTLSGGTANIGNNSNQGEAHPYLVEVQGPGAVLEHLSFKGLDQQDHPLASYNSQFFLSTAGATPDAAPVPAISFAVSPTLLSMGTATSTPFTLVPPSTSAQAVDFATGYVSGVVVGFGKGLWSLVSGPVELVKWAWNAETDALGSRMAYVWTGGATSWESETELEINRGVSDMAKTLYDVNETISNSEAALLQAAAGNFTPLFKQSQTLARVGMVGIEYLKKLAEQWADQSAFDAGYQAGQIVGRIVFEIAAILVPITKLNLLSKITVMDDLFELLKAGKIFAADSTAYTACMTAFRGIGYAEDGTKEAGTIAKMWKLVSELSDGDPLTIELGSSKNIGYVQPPYYDDELVYTIKLKSDTRFYRSFDNSGSLVATWPQGPWLSTLDEMEGMTAAEMRNSFALPSTPTDVVPVDVPAGSTIEISRAGTNAWGPGGSIQIRLKSRYALEWFKIGEQVPLPTGE